MKDKAATRKEITGWHPPFLLFAAGVGSARHASYYNDASKTSDNQRILIKKTLSGCGTLYVSGKRLEVLPGMAFVIERPGPYVYCYEGDGTPWEFEYVSIHFTNPSGLLPPNLCNHPVFPIDHYPELSERLHNLILARMSPTYEPSLVHSAEAYTFFLSYIATRMATRPLSSPQAQDFRLIIENHLTEPVTIKDCAVQAGYTHEAFTRIFTEAYGMPPSHYLQTRRLQKACGLLENSTQSIKEIAVNCGFSDQNYFARAFKKALGGSPSEYRRNSSRFLSSRLQLEMKTNTQ